MNNIKSYIILVLFVIIGILLGMRQCSSPKIKETFLKGKKTIKWDTIPRPFKIVETKKVLYPKWDTIKLIDTTFDASLCNYERTYNDSITDSSVTIYRNIKTIGLLKSLQTNYRLKEPILVKNTSRIDTLIKPNKWELFGNSEIGGNLNNFNISIGLALKYKTVYYGYRYGVIDQTHNITIGIRLLKSKK